MLLPAQLQALIYHFIIGNIFGFFFSFFSLCTINSSLFIRIIIIDLFVIIFAILSYIGLYFINGGVMQLYCIILIFAGIIFYYSFIYHFFLPLFTRIRRFISHFVNRGRVAKLKMCVIMKKRVGLKKGGQKMDKQKSGGPKARRRFVNRLKNIVLIAFSSLFIYNIVNEVLTTKELQASLAEARVVINEIEEEKVTLEEEKAKLQNPEYVKRYARGKLLVSQDGEQVFSLEPSADE